MYLGGMPSSSKGAAHLAHCKKEGGELVQNESSEFACVATQYPPSKRRNERQKKKFYWSLPFCHLPPISLIVLDLGLVVVLVHVPLLRIWVWL
jgi:hypothetical protein